MLAGECLFSIPPLSLYLCIARRFLIEHAGLFFFNLPAKPRAERERDGVEAVKQRRRDVATATRSMGLSLSLCLGEMSLLDYMGLPVIHSHPLILSLSALPYSLHTCAHVHARLVDVVVVVLGDIGEGPPARPRGD